MNARIGFAPPTPPRPPVVDDDDEDEDVKLTTAQGKAVATGIDHAKKRMPRRETAAEFIYFAESAGIEAAMEVMRGNTSLDPDVVAERVEDAVEAAASAFLCCLPTLRGRKAIQGYIGCVAIGMQHGWIDQLRSQKMLYAAQVAIGALDRRKRK